MADAMRHDVAATFVKSEPRKFRTLYGCTL